MQRAPNGLSYEDLFWRRVERRSATECWEWRGCIQKGYGYFSARVDGDRVSRLAHRVAWQLTHGPIPDDLGIDHLCHNADLACLGGPDCLHRRCVNPAHLEPVTAAVNNRRASRPRPNNAYRVRTACPHGHPYDEINTRWYRDRRYCKACQRAACRARYWRLKAEAAA